MVISAVNGKNKSSSNFSQGCWSFTSYLLKKTCIHLFPPRLGSLVLVGKQPKRKINLNSKPGA